MATELLIFLLPGGFLALWVTQTLRLWWRDQQEQEQIHLAVIREKLLVHEPGSGWEPDQRYVLTFSLPDGSHRNFVVTQAQYQRVHAGEAGQLHIRGTRFHGFDTTP